jgi:hypothetical protein
LSTSLSFSTPLFWSSTVFLGHSFSCCELRLVSGMSGLIIGLAGPIHREGREDALLRNCNLNSFLQQRERRYNKREYGDHGIVTKAYRARLDLPFGLRPTAARSRCYADRPRRSSSVRFGRSSRWCTGVGCFLDANCKIFKANHLSHVIFSMCPCVALGDQRTFISCLIILSFAFC